MNKIFDQNALCNIQLVKDTLQTIANSVTLYKNNEKNNFIISGEVISQLFLYQQYDTCHIVYYNITDDFLETCYLNSPFFIRSIWSPFEFVSNDTFKRIILDKSNTTENEAIKRYNFLHERAYYSHFDKKLYLSKKMYDSIMKMELIPVNDNPPTEKVVKYYLQKGWKYYPQKEQHFSPKPEQLLPIALTDLYFLLEKYQFISIKHGKDFISDNIGRQHYQNLLNTFLTMKETNQTEIYDKKVYESYTFFSKYIDHLVKSLSLNIQECESMTRHMIEANKQIGDMIR